MIGVRRRRTLDFPADAARRGRAVDQPTEEQRRVYSWTTIGKFNVPLPMVRQNEAVRMLVYPWRGNGSELRRMVHAAHTPAEVLEAWSLL